MLSQLEGSGRFITVCIAGRVAPYTLRRSQTAVAAPPQLSRKNPRCGSCPSTRIGGTGLARWVFRWLGVWRMFHVKQPGSNRMRPFRSEFYPTTSFGTTHLMKEFTVMQPKRSPTCDNDRTDRGAQTRRVGPKGFDSVSVVVNAKSACCRGRFGTSSIS